MRILVVNVNTTITMTRAIAAQARDVARPGTEIVPLTPFFGPESVEGNFDSYLAAVGVLDRVLAYEAPYDAVVQAGFGDHGREGLQEMCDVPVVDITDAAAHAACLIGRSFSVVTSLDRAVPQIEDRLRLSGLYNRCASIRASGVGVLDLKRDRVAATEAVVAQARAAVEHDGAEVVCLGCGGMAGLDAEVRSATGAPAVDGVTAAVALAESLVGLGLSTSKVRTYLPPREKTVAGWPLSKELGMRPHPSPSPARLSD
ncbi:allantoin racemase [Lipingzhangella halophila]|uniref:Hydantoin racemase n=1 Tax=Lipingzhangella halophila TaxID=1783352 RepID=A0A7W7RK97_9ACTN|nr:aspartate/glutamate racemase family protein [Lipingzhangella halophila]MBB4933520.1 allantoin racemase [Lipingzhangella halophila]